MNLTRREALGGASALGLFLIGGGAAWAAGGAKPAMTIYRSEGCNCCLKWADLARAAGYPVTVNNSDDIMAVKSRFGVPRELMSCHTTSVGGYVVEGHVPFEAVAKLLRDKPADIVGIALPGMPAGSPGMEVHGGHDHGHARPALEVSAFTPNGAKRAFAY